MMIAPISLRILSAALDLLFLLVAYQIPLAYMSGATTIYSILDRFLLFAFLVLVLYPLFFPIFSSFLITTFGGTIGKILTGCEIVDGSGKKLSFWRAFLRNYIGYIVSGSLAGLGFIWIAIDSKRRGWHDMIADSKVVVVQYHGVLTGIFALLLLLGINYYFGVASITKLNENLPLYQDILKEFVGMMSR